jgi:hypothetical protein
MRGMERTKRALFKRVCLVRANKVLALLLLSLSPTLRLNLFVCSTTFRCTIHDLDLLGHETGAG